MRKAVAILGILGFGFALLCLGKEFVHDDLALIQANPDLRFLDSFAHCFQFQMQATKPVTDWVLAVTHWLGRSEVGIHRLVSVFLHILNGCFWVLFLKRYASSGKVFQCLPKSFPYLVGALFLFAPVHTETLAVVQFRGEILASLFSVWALLLTQIYAQKEEGYARFGLLLGTMACFVLASFAKEVFVVILPPLLYLEWARLSKNRTKAFPVCLTFAGFGVGCALYLFFEIDSKSIYSYRETISWSLWGTSLHWSLVFRAFVEGLVKLAGIAVYTTIRLEERANWATFIPGVFQLAILCGAMYAVLRGTTRPTRFWWWAVGLGLGLYLAIPNKNIGSEHYLYFAAFPFWTLSVWGLWKLVSKMTTQSKAAWSALCALLIVFSVVRFELRALDYRDRVRFYRSERNSHPESPWAWKNFAVALAMAGAPLADTWPLLLKAKELGASEGRLLTAALTIYAESGEDRKLAALLIRASERGFYGRGMCQYFLKLSQLQSARGEFSAALDSLRAASEHEAMNPELEPARRELLRNWERRLMAFTQRRDRCV